GRVAALEAGVVLDTDAREHGRLLTTQPLQAPVAAVGGKARLLGSDPRPPRGEEVPDVALGVHGPHAMDPRAAEGGPAGTRLNAVSLAGPSRGSIDSTSGRTHETIERTSPCELRCSTARKTSPSATVPTQ